MIRRGTVILAALGALSFSPFQREIPENRDGTAKYEEQKYDQSSEEFKKGAERRDDSAELSYNLGAALMKKGDLDGARAAWEQALSRGPSPELKGRIYDGLGALSANKQQYQEAENFFKRSLQNHPDRDTAANLEIVRRLLKQQQQQQEEEKDKKDEKQEGQKQDQKQDQKQEEQQQQQQQQQQQAQKPEEKKEEQQQAAQAGKKEKDEQDKKDEKQLLAPFRQRKNLQITPFMLEKQGDPQGGQTW